MSLGNHFAFLFVLSLSNVLTLPTLGINMFPDHNISQADFLATEGKTRLAVWGRIVSHSKAFIS
jgi:hypothetical protein